MKHLPCIVGVIFCLAMSVDIGYGLVAPQLVPFNYFDGSLDNLQMLNRVARQAPVQDFTMPPPPQPPTPPPPPSMFEDFSRKRREAKGGGSMPTRKG